MAFVEMLARRNFPTVLTLSVFASALDALIRTSPVCRSIAPSSYVVRLKERGEEVRDALGDAGWFGQGGHCAPPCTAADFAASSASHLRSPSTG